MKGSKRGFTLIELLVVIAIIAILAAILFPVFAKAKDKARQASCINNVKQLTLAMIQYTTDWDGIYPAVWLGNYAPDPGYIPIPGAVPTQYYYWFQQIYPYVKNVGTFKCPSDAWVLSASYMPFDGARDDVFLATDGTTLTKVSYIINDNVDEESEAKVQDPAGTFLMWDCSPDYCYYYSCVDIPTYNRLRPYAGYEAEGRHSGGENYGFCDGHVKWVRRAAAPDDDVRFTLGAGIPDQSHPGYVDPWP